MQRQRWYPTPRRVDVTQPAAGAGWSRVNDSGGMWVVRSVAHLLVTDANVANRTVSITATAGEDVWFATTAQVDQTATLTRRISAFCASPASTVDKPVVLLPWPEDGLWLPPGNVLAGVITNVQATDQVSAIFLSVIELPDTLPAALIPMITTHLEEDGV